MPVFFTGTLFHESLAVFGGIQSILLIAAAKYLGRWPGFYYTLMCVAFTISIVRRVGSKRVCVRSQAVRVVLALLGVREAGVGWESVAQPVQF